MWKTRNGYIPRSMELNLSVPRGSIKLGFLHSCCSGGDVSRPGSRVYDSSVWWGWPVLHSSVRSCFFWIWVSDLWAIFLLMWIWIPTTCRGLEAVYILVSRMHRTLSHLGSNGTTCFIFSARGLRLLRRSSWKTLLEYLGSF
jgi:hypothetical protein